ncbi:MAG: SusD/RagB family nutrient-binding outer membrane lipoprotein [Mucilaginibacter sp.]
MKKYILIVTMLFTVGISGCKKDFLSLEVNPNTPSVTTPQFTLSGAEKVAADIVNTSYPQYGVWVGFWTSSGNYVPSPQLQQYQFTTDNYQVFTTLYSNLTNFNVLETQSTGVAGLANFQAIAKIMKAYDFEQLVDVYNDVPYTQAFKAPSILFPAYDKGQFIYNDLVKQLDAAIALINANASATNPGISDIVYHGNMTNWKKFANTLKLRIAIRQSNLGTNAAQADLAATSAEGYIDASSGAAANPGYANSDSNGGQESPFWRVYGFDQNGNPQTGNVYYRANAYSVSLLTNNNDPRLTKIYAPNNAGAYKGIIFGDPNAAANAATSAIGPGLLKSPTMDAVLLAPAESYFLQSEAVQRGWLTGDAMALYNSGITASFTALGLTAAQAVTYYSQGLNDVNWASSPNKIEAIITQKYISLNGYGNLEAFNEYRRTHYPVGVPRSIDPKAIGTTIPFRVFYPTSEYQQNAANVAAEGTIDPFASKIFWAL